MPVSSGDRLTDTPRNVLPAIWDLGALSPVKLMHINYHICMYHLFIYQSINGLLSCCIAFTIVTLLQTWAYTYVWVPAFTSFGYIPRIGTAGSYGNSMPTFLRTVMLSSTGAEPLCIPTGSAQWLQALHMLPNTSCCFFAAAVLVGR